MDIKGEYKPLSKKEKEEKSKQLAGYLILDQYCKVLDSTEGQIFNQLLRFCDERSSLYKSAKGVWRKWEKILREAEKSFLEDEKGPIPSWKKTSLWRNWYRSELHELFLPFSNYKWSLLSLQDAATVYINAVKKFYWGNAPFDQDGTCPLSRSQWENMRTATIAMFLSSEILNHPVMRQNIYQFSKAPFGCPIPKEILEKKDENEVTFAKRRHHGLLECRKELEIMLTMGQLQKEFEMHQRQSNDSEEETYYEYSYPRLCAIHFIYESKIRASEDMDRDIVPRDTSAFRIFKYISMRKDMFSTPSDKGFTKLIPKACADYSKVLDTIAQWGPMNDTGIFKNAKGYVIGSIMATELEEAYRLHFASAYASAICKQGQKFSEHAIQTALNILGRFPYYLVFPINFEELMKTSDFLKDADKFILSQYECAHNILNYKMDLSYITSKDEQACNSYVERSRTLRNEQLTLYSVLQNIFHEQIEQEWSDSDFYAVAKFFYEKYNIIDVLRKISFPFQSEQENSCEIKMHYENMQKFYEAIHSFKEAVDTSNFSSHSLYCRARELLYGKEKSSHDSILRLLLPDNIPDSKSSDALTPANVSMPVPDFTKIRMSMKHGNITVIQMWQEYSLQCRASGKLPHCPVQFAILYGDYLARNYASLHLDQKPGEIMIVKLSAVKTDSDKRILLFMATLPYSEYSYVGALDSLDRKSWATAHINAYNYFCGVTHALLGINYEINKHNQEANHVFFERAYLELASHYNTVILSAGSLSPGDRTRISKIFGSISDFFLPDLKRQHFSTPKEINEMIWEQLETFNQQPSHKIDVSRACLFTEEKQFLHSLPSCPFELVTWKVATVPPNCYVCVNQVYYRLPSEYILQDVLVCLAKEYVLFFSGRDLIYRYPRPGKNDGNYQIVDGTCLEHLFPNQYASPQENSGSFIRCTQLVEEKM